ncbi:hypothetical protein CPB83DRAFT_854664 [Crepidotus variabilis]|uniref:Uncharacterized protein n=1 Tax=Crepidotus variabilis TaxID=179855 RepID=A0A9P6EEU1_9AGAR|nr:hypothetical protein CPB83DRAFT_854664 [Crepidotus variabilis]
MICRRVKVNDISGPNCLYRLFTCLLTAYQTDRRRELFVFCYVTALCKSIVGFRFFEA